MKTNYIYLLQEREFIKTNENIYKVGMTTKENHERFNQYPKGSILLFQMICNNCKNIENMVIKIFKDKFINRKDIGNEYFEGNYKHMMSIIYETISNESDNNLESVAIEKDISSKCEENVSSKCEENVSSTNISKKDSYEECNYVMSRKYNLEIHNNISVKNITKVFSCEVCDYTCFKQSVLNKHLSTPKHIKAKNMLIKATIGEYICEKCQINFKHQSSYCRHKKKH
jgi:hypothetical protein